MVEEAVHSVAQLLGVARDRLVDARHWQPQLARGRPLRREADHAGGHKPGPVLTDQHDQILCNQQRRSLQGWSIGFEGLADGPGNEASNLAGRSFDVGKCDRYLTVGRGQ